MAQFTQHTKEQAIEAAEVIRKYMNREKVIADWFGDEAAEVTMCTLRLLHCEEPTDEFNTEKEWATKQASIIYHMQEQG